MRFPRRLADRHRGLVDTSVVIDLERADGSLNDDIIGASAGHGGEATPNDVRLFSEALPSVADPKRVNAVGSENESPARESRAFCEGGRRGVRSRDARVSRLPCGPLFARSDQKSFGVRAVDTAGHTSVAAYPTPSK